LNNSNTPEAGTAGAGAAGPDAKGRAAPQARHKGKHAKSLRAFWWKQVHQWHWISAAISLIGMLLFAITGITLNHAGKIEAKPVTSTREARLPPALLASLKEPMGGTDKQHAPVPAELKDWLDAQMKVNIGGADAEWSADEIYISLPRPGGDAWLAIDRGNGSAHYELTQRGAIAYLNDLHKGRNTGTAWSWFIDVFAVACVLFSLTGLLLLQLHAGKRPMTWPTVALGLGIPLLLAIIFIH